MKRIAFIFVLTLAVSIGKAQVLEITIHNDSVSVFSVIDSIQHDTIKWDNGILNCHREISQVRVKKETNNNKSDNFTVKVGANKLVYNTLDGRGVDSYKVMSVKKETTGNVVTKFTLQANDCISVYKETNPPAATNIGSCHILVSDSDIIKNIKVNSNLSDTAYLFVSNDTTDRRFHLSINNKKNYVIDSIKINYNDTTLLIGRDSCFSISPQKLSSDSTEVYAIVHVKNSNGEHKLRLGLAIKESKRNNILWLTIGSICIVLIITYFSVHVNKWKTESKEYNTIEGKKIKILSKEKPKIGDKSNTIGTFKTEDGYEYVCEKKRWRFYGEITKIFTEIKTSSSDTFYIEITDKKIDGEANEWVLNNLPKLEGSCAHPLGAYQLEDGSKVTISEDNIITSVTSSVTMPKTKNPITLLDINNNAITFTSASAKPEVGDKASPDGEFVTPSGKQYRVEKGVVTAITQVDIKALLLKLHEANATISGIPARIEQERENERAIVEKEYQQKIDEEYISLELHEIELKDIEGQKNIAESDAEKERTRANRLSGELNQANKKKKELEDSLLSAQQEVIRIKAEMAQIKVSASKKNMYYILQVQETLFDIAESFRDVYKDIDNSQIKESLILPLISGVKGLSTGILTWKEDFKTTVIDDSNDFFGGDLFSIKEDAVKEVLSQKFISGIVKSDSFSKFIRLYELSRVPFIRKQFIEAKMDIDTLEKLYYKLITMVSDFGYTIICPQLFEEQYSEKKYQWFNSTNLFNIISLSEEEKRRIKEKGAETIIDVNQIGYQSPWMNRKATAVTPDF